MSISYDGVGTWCATFAAGTGAEEGKVVKVSANGTVSKCAANDGFCGVVAAMGRDGKACSVQLGGLVPDRLHSLNLFEGSEDEQNRQRLLETMDALNHKYGMQTLAPAAMLEAYKAAPTRIAFHSIPDMF